MAFFHELFLTERNSDRTLLASSEVDERLKERDGANQFGN